MNGVLWVFSTYTPYCDVISSLDKYLCSNLNTAYVIDSWATECVTLPTLLACPSVGTSHMHASEQVSSPHYFNRLSLLDITSRSSYGRWWPLLHSLRDVFLCLATSTECCRFCLWLSKSEGYSKAVSSEAQTLNLPTSLYNRNSLLFLSYWTHIPHNAFICPLAGDSS